MARAFVTIHKEEERAEAMRWLRYAPIGTRIDFRGPKRTLPQNDRMWSMLTDLVRQKIKINGSQYTAEQWKVIFIQALGKEQELLPTLNGAGFFATGYSSSDLSIPEMSDLIESIFAFGAEQGVVWTDPQIASYEAMRTR